MRRYAPVPSVESFTVDRRPACAFRNRLHHWRPSVRARFPLPAPQSGASGSTVAGRGALREYVAARAPSGLGHGGASPGAAGVRRPDVLGTTTFREILRRGIDMDREALMQWLRETSAALDAMDADITARIGEWPALRDSLHQTGEAMAALCADADAARERLIAAYRSEAEAVRQLVSGAAACAGAILGAGRAAAEEMVAAARADAERARTDAKASAVATLRDAQERAQHAVASAERLAEQRLAEVRHEADFILGEARRQAGEAAEAVATARQQAVETAARAQQDADAVLDDARRQAEELVATARQDAAEAVATARQQAVEIAARAQQDADAVLDDARRQAAALVAAALIVQYRVRVLLCPGGYLHGLLPRRRYRLRGVLPCRRHQFLGLPARIVQYRVRLLLCPSGCLHGLLPRCRYGLRSLAGLASSLAEDEVGLVADLGQPLLRQPLGGSDRVLRALLGVPQRGDRRCLGVCARALGVRPSRRDHLLGRGPTGTKNRPGARGRAGHELPHGLRLGSVGRDQSLAGGVGVRAQRRHRFARLVQAVAQRRPLPDPGGDVGIHRVERGRRFTEPLHQRLAIHIDTSPENLSKGSCAQDVGPPDAARAATYSRRAPRPATVEPDAPD